MKFVFLIVFVIFINTVKSQSTSEILNRCEIRKKRSEQILKCRNFQHTYLPYTEEFKQVTGVRMYGNYNYLLIDPAYENLASIYMYSTNFQNFELNKFANFTKLKHLSRVSQSEQVVNVDFTGTEKLKRLKKLFITASKMIIISCENFKSTNLEKLKLSGNIENLDFSCLPKTIKLLSLKYNEISTLDPQSCEALKNLSNLTKLYLYGNELTDFNFACLPQNLVELDLNENLISTISNESCQYLKSLTSLRYLYLEWNNLQNFQFGCLPTSIRYVKLQGNNITEINDLSDIPHSHQVTLGIYSNPIRCTCSLLRDYVQLLSGIVLFYDHINCANTDSKLANYPWGNNAAAIKLHDATSLGCLTGGEDTDIDIRLNQCEIRDNWDDRQSGEQILECRNFQHTYLPYTKKFKKVIDIDISVTGTLSELAIDPAYDLEKLTLSGNIENFDFSCLPKTIKLLYLYNNKIFTVDPQSCEALKNLSSLTELYLNVNKLTDFNFACLPQNLVKLNLGWNQISTISNESCQYLKNLSSLTELYLYVNKFIDFNFACLPQNLVYLNLFKNQISTISNESCQYLKNLSSLTELALNANKLTDFNFACLPQNLVYLNLGKNQISTISNESCQYLKNLSSLTELALNANKLTDFNFACLPQNLINLWLYGNQISTISNESCQYLKSLTSLRYLDLHSNNLQHFQFGCLPTSIEHVSLYNNNITEINDLADFPHSHPVKLGIYSNPIRCTCSLLRDYVQLLDSGNVYFGTISCANVDSELANYPWDNNPTAIKLYDPYSLGCLTSGEDTDIDTVN